MTDKKSTTYKAFLKAGVHVIPEVGDYCKVIGVYPGTTNPLFEPAVEISLKLVKKPDEKDKEAGR